MARASITIADRGTTYIAKTVNACKALGMEVTIARNAEELRGASHVLLAGGGAFGPSMEELEQTGLASGIRDHVQRGNPYLGICLGFHVLLQTGIEEQVVGGGQQRAAPAKAKDDRAKPGFRILEGDVVPFGSDVHVPHAGWNRVEIARKHPLFTGVENGTYMYFSHSYYTKGVNEADALAYAKYGETFTCAAARGSAVGTQFHPERSGADGLRFLRNFINWRP